MPRRNSECPSRVGMGRFLPFGSLQRCLEIGARRLDVDDFDATVLISDQEVNVPYKEHLVVPTLIHVPTATREHLYPFRPPELGGCC